MTDKPFSIADLRRDYASRALDESTTDPDPIAQFRVWFQEALNAELLDANAMALATVAPDGQPSVRIVLIKGLDSRGLMFFTHYVSPKGLDLAANPVASVLFYWAPLERQVRISGSITRVAAQESDRYFASRPRDSQIAAWAAPQSSELPDRATLEQRFAKLQERFAGESVPRPPDWGGYVLSFERCEFWQGRLGRLHDRVLYKRADEGAWTRVRLAP
jgi:pyridoxamine 5'-phosphate oxidase